MERMGNENLAKRVDIESRWEKEARKTQIAIGDCIKASQSFRFAHRQSFSFMSSRVLYK